MEKTLLQELWNWQPLDEKVGKKTAASIYHRDYMKTRKKPYRKYDPSEYAAGEHKESK